MRSLLPAPSRDSWAAKFRAGLEFKGWGTRVGIPILAMMLLGVIVVVATNSNSGGTDLTPPASSLGFPPASLAGSDFTATSAAGRGVDQELSQVASDGPDIVAVGSQSGGRIARAQFFFSPNDGRSWSLSTVQQAGGGTPPPGHAADFVAGGQGAWVAIGPSAVWTSGDGRTWTLVSPDGLPLQAGDQISALERTSDGFIAIGTNVPDGNAAKSSPVIFRSANGTGWQRLGAAQLGLAAGGGRVLDLKYAAVSGKTILVAGDVTVTELVGRSGRSQTMRTSGAWLSRDGGSTWQSAVTPGVAPGGPGEPLITGVAADGNGYMLTRPATVGKAAAVDVYRSATGTAWTFQAALTARGGLVTGQVSGGPAGAVVTGQAGAAKTLTAFVSVGGATWRQAPALAQAAPGVVSGVTMTGAGAVLAGTVTSPDSEQAALTVVPAAGNPARVSLAHVPGASLTQLALTDVAAQDGTVVAVGSANGDPAVWTSANGGGSWQLAVGATPSVFGRAGSQQLTSVTRGLDGWLAVGGTSPASIGAQAAPQATAHPVVVTSTDGRTWQAADTESAFTSSGTSSGLYTVAAATGSGGYVIVGYQDVSQTGHAEHTVAAAWWSAGLTGWERADDAAPGALDGPGTRQMLAVTAVSAGFVAVGAHGDAPSAWLSPDGRTWRQLDLPLPAGASEAELQQVASTGKKVVAVGTMDTAAGTEPFAASSADGGATWTEDALPAPAALTSVTALAAADGTFVATGSYGTTPGHQNVVVWTSANGASWTADKPSGQGLTGAGIQAITGLTASGSTLTGVGYTASAASEEPVFWQSPLR